MQIFIKNQTQNFQNSLSHKWANVSYCDNWVLKHFNEYYYKKIIKFIL